MLQTTKFNQNSTIMNSCQWITYAHIFYLKKKKFIEGLTPEGHVSILFHADNWCYHFVFLFTVNMMHFLTAIIVYYWVFND